MNRRNLLKWSAAAGAALSLPMWKVWEVVEGTHGYATAAAGANLTHNRFVHLNAGRGGFAWFQLLWPHYQIAQNIGGNPNFAYHAPPGGGMSATSDNPLWVSDHTPLRDAPNTRQVTAMVGGANETHTASPQNLTNAGGQNVYGAIASMQLANPSLVPVITVGDNVYGAAQGSPVSAAVPGPDNMVDLFNSRASSVGGALENPGDATLFHANYQALVQLNRAAAVSTKRGAYLTGLDAAEFVGINLGAQLTPTPNDIQRYGLAGAPNRVMRIGLTMITAVKAFSLGLTNHISVDAMEDDPHGAFNNMPTLNTTVMHLRDIFNAFWADLEALDDPFLAGTKIADNTVVSVHGDTPKTPRNRGGWPDGTPGGFNWTYIYSAGWLKTGWFGRVGVNDQAGWDPVTGGESGMSSQQLAPFAAKALLHSVARGDENAVRGFIGDNVELGEGVVNFALM